MAKPTTYQGTLLALYLEDTAAPGTYIKPCGLNNHTFTWSKNMNEVTVPDCDDPEAPAWIERGVESLDFSGSGEGILAEEAVDNWWAAFDSTESINARVYLGAPDNVTIGRYWQGKVHVNQFEVAGNIGEKVTCTVSVVSDGEMTFNHTGTSA